MVTTPFSKIFKIKINFFRIAISVVIPVATNVISQIHKGVSTRKSLNLLCEHMAFISKTEPKIIQKALSDNHWISVMQEELNQFSRNDVWSLVSKTNKMNVIGTKWVFKNKMDEQGIIVRNKSRSVAKGYNKEERIDLMKLMHQLQGLKRSNFYSPMLV